MNIHEELTAVLCDAEGQCCISGSNADRDIIDKALAALAELESENKALLEAIRKHKAGFEEPDFGTSEDKELWEALTKEEL